MDALTPSSISTAIDETIAELDRLHQPRRERQALHLAELRSRVAALDVGTPPDVEPVGEQAPGRRHTGREPFVPMPRRTTHGGGFGPVVRDKIRREALERGRW